MRIGNSLMRTGVLRALPPVSQNPAPYRQEAERGRPGGADGEVGGRRLDFRLLGPASAQLVDHSAIW